MRRIWGEIPLWTRNASTPGPLTIRQWPVQARGIRICRTFLHWHSGTFKKLMAIMQAMQELHCHARLARDSCMAIGFLTCAMCKKVWHKSYTSGQCPLTRRKFNSRTQCCQGQCKVLCQNDTLFQSYLKFFICHYNSSADCWSSPKYKVYFGQFYLNGMNSFQWVYVSLSVLEAEIPGFYLGSKIFTQKFSYWLKKITEHKAINVLKRQARTDCQELSNWAHSIQEKLNLQCLHCNEVNRILCHGALVT